MNINGVYNFKGEYCHEKPIYVHENKTFRLCYNDDIFTYDLYWIIKCNGVQIVSQQTNCPITNWNQKYNVDSVCKINQEFNVIVNNYHPKPALRD